MIFTLKTASAVAVKMDLFRELIDGAPLAVYVRGTFREIRRNGKPGELVFARDWREVRGIVSRDIEAEIDGEIVRMRPDGEFDLSIEAASVVEVR